MAIASAVCLAFLRSRWQQAAAWTALAFAGQACALQLLNVGSSNILQRFHNTDVLLGTWRGAFLVALFVQGLLVARGLAGHREELLRHARGALRSWHGLLFAFLILYSIVPASTGDTAPLLGSEAAGKLASLATKVVLGLLVAAIQGGNLLLAARAIPDAEYAQLQNWWRNQDRAALPWLAALWVLVVSTVLAVFVFERLPHVPDEVSYLFQAKYFSLGCMHLPAPPDPAALNPAFAVVKNGMWYSAMPGHGWSALLAVGVLLGAPWLVNPLLGAAGILLAHRVASRFAGRNLADGVALLLAASPWLLFLSASMMPHAASLVWTLAALLGLYEARERGSIAYAMLAGAAIGALLHTRPLEAVAVGVFGAAWWLSGGRGKVRVAAVLAAGMVFAAFAWMYLEYNRTFTGERMTTPINVLFDEVVYPGANRLGFGADVGNFGWKHLDPLSGHGPLDVAINTNHNFYMTQFELFGWGCGSLLFVFLLAARGEFRRHAWAWGFVGMFWMTMNVYWFSGGPDFGARYWYPMLVPLALLTLRGAQWIAARKDETAAASSRVWAFLALASVLGCMNLLPWRALDKYTNYRGVRTDVRRLSAERQFGRSLVLIRGERALKPYESSAAYSALALNPPRYDRDAPGTIYALDLGAKSVERLRAYYADRPVWVLASPSITGAGFQVLEGPLPAKSAGGKK